MKDPTPDTPMTEDDLHTVKHAGIDEYTGRNKERRAKIAAEKASLVAKAVALASSPDYKAPRWVLGLASFAAGAFLTFWAPAMGISSEDVELARQGVAAVEKAAGAVIDGAEDGELTPQEATGAAMMAAPFGLALANKLKKKK